MSSIDVNEPDGLLWEHVPDRKGLPPLLRSLIRRPPQRVRFDGSRLVFDGPRVHDAYPHRDPSGRQRFRERRVADRTEPVPWSEVTQVAVYPVAGGWMGQGRARAFYTVVDLHRVGDARTVATIDRRLGTDPEAEVALAAAMWSIAGPRWCEPGDDAWPVDHERVAQWAAVTG